MRAAGHSAPRLGLLGGRYEPRTVIASGGMGQVWSGRDALLGRPVAIKVLGGELAGDPSFLARFRAEAQHAAMLNHPNIAAVHDYGEQVADDGGEPLAFLIMELVEGEALATLLAPDSPLDVPRTLSILAQTAAALAAAHEAGVIHRDIKPANVLVRADGVVKITDFGIAWSAASAPLTGTGQIVGTAHYLSPEQAQGAKATPASDVYSLGVVAYECLAGRRPFDGDNTVQIALKHIDQQPAPLPADIPEPVRSLVAHAMAKDPAERIPDGAHLRDAVDRVRSHLGDRGAQAIPAAARPVRERTARGSPTAVLPAAAAALAGSADPPTGREGTRPLAAVGEAPHSRRNGRLVVAVAGVAIVLLAAILVGLMTGPGLPSTPAARTTPPTSGGSSAAARPTPARSSVDAALMVGRSVGEVRARLTALGLVPRLAPIQTASVAAGTVIAVAPTGALERGQAVTVTYAVAPPAGQGGGGGKGRDGGGDGGD
jgi:hypothetical protein